MPETTTNSGPWRGIAAALIASIAGWWLSRATLEIPPKWFREDVQENTAAIKDLDKRLHRIEAKLNDEP